MQDFSVISLFSGSSGNATYVRIGGKQFLIDAGVSAKRLVSALEGIGVAPQALAAILITHEHIDHVKGLAVFSAKYGIPVHMTEASARGMVIAPALEAVLIRHETEYELQLDGVHITAFEVPHDSACCVGYRLEAGAHTLSVATDIGHITRPIVERFLGAEAVILESNHDEALLACNPRYPRALKERIHSENGHLSNEMCRRFLLYLAKNGTRYALLAHLSKDNNTPAHIASQMAVVQAEAEFTYRIALPDSATTLL